MPGAGVTVWCQCHQLPRDSGLCGPAIVITAASVCCCSLQVLPLLQKLGQKEPICNFLPPSH